LRFYSFKDVQWTRRRPSLAIILMIVLIGATALFSHITLLLITAIYTVHGPIIQLVRFVRHRLASRTA